MHSPDRELELEVLRSGGCEGQGRNPSSALNQMNATEICVTREHSAADDLSASGLNF